jgi:Zn-dependent metalloprotease
MRRLVRSVSIFVLLLAGPALATASEKEDGKRKAPIDERGIERLQMETGARVSFSRATGAVRFVSVPDGGGDLMAAGGAEVKTKSKKFLDDYAGIFGLRDSRELVLGREESDAFGGRHLKYYQFHEGVPVFAAQVKAHFDGNGRLVAVNGTVVPGLDVDVTPSTAATDASAVAIRAVSASNPDAAAPTARSGVLMIYRAGLVRGVPGDNHLVYQVEVSNDVNVREFVYVDAHSGKIVDRLPGIYDAMTRRAYDGRFLPVVPPEYPGSPFWVEGQAFPTAVPEANNMITSSKEVYNLYKNAFGRDSYDGAGHILDSIFNRGYGCPNASWNGAFISFCTGFTTDDITGHEWTHAYTEYTDGLIYEWQSGALNESYSDIFGETIDRINGRDAFPFLDGPRSTDACSTYFGAPPPSVTITGGSAAGTYTGLASLLEPALPVHIGPTDMAIASTAAPAQPTGACGAVSGVSGKIAIIDWTLLADGVTNECGSVARSTNAFNAGAAGVIFVAPATGLIALTGSGAIATVQVTHADGEKIKAGLPAQATLTLDPGTDESARWLIGEDDTNPQAFGAGRDMWNPRCFGNPGKVSDAFEYVCDINNDLGGVHTNSGIPNHAYALLVDGGTYNGKTIQGIGLTKAAHIYYRAKTVYQVPSTDFADHADAIEQAAHDLQGQRLRDLVTGALTNEKITGNDVKQVKNVMEAVEMRAEPPCNFAPPQLDQAPPALCPGGHSAGIYDENFDHPNRAGQGWTISHGGTTPDFDGTEWEIVGNLPDDRSGQAFFAPDKDYTCNAYTFEDQTVVRHLDSPLITLPSNATAPRLTFVHWFATEPGFDGGNVRISVNGGPWTLIANGDFLYNGYTEVLFPSTFNSNPLAGQTAFAGEDDGSTGGTWGRSIVNLAPYAHAGDTIQIRFDLGHDSCAGRTGWYVDDVSVFRCR